MRQLLLRTLFVSYITIFAILLFAWIASEFRFIGIEYDVPLRRADSLIINRTCLFIESGVVSFGCQREIDFYDTTWADGERRWRYYYDRIGTEDSLLPSSFTYSNSPIWNQLGFGILTTGTFDSASRSGLFAVFVPCWFIIIILCSLSLFFIVLISRCSKWGRVRGQDKVSGEEKKG